jgi:hypothetical protein
LSDVKDLQLFYEKNRRKKKYRLSLSCLFFIVTAALVGEIFIYISILIWAIFDLFSAGSKTRVEFQNGLYQSHKSTTNGQYNGQKITVHTIIYNTKPQ